MFKSKNRAENPALCVRRYKDLNIITHVLQNRRYYVPILSLFGVAVHIVLYTAHITVFKMENQPTCVFKINCDANTDTVKLFNKKTLKTAKDKLNIRKTCNLKYCDVILPETVDNTSGYHYACYKLFTSINRRSLDLYEKMACSPGTSNAG